MYLWKQYKGSVGFSNSDENMRSKDYVESLHQNNKSTLLYGKNNVVVYMVSLFVFRIYCKKISISKSLIRFPHFVSVVLYLSVVC